MIDIKTVELLAEDFLKETDLFIVDLNINETNLITILLDSMQNVSIGDCISLSKHIENSIDREIEDYELMVSSAGIGHPLKLEKQYKKNIGRLVEVLDNLGIKQSGILREVTENSFGVEITKKIKPEGKKRKELITTIETFLYNEIKSAVIIPEIGRKKK